MPRYPVLAAWRAVGSGFQQLVIESEEREDGGGTIDFKLVARLEPAGGASQRDSVVRAYWSGNLRQSACHSGAKGAR